MADIGKVLFVTFIVVPVILFAILTGIMRKEHLETLKKVEDY